MVTQVSATDPDGPDEGITFLLTAGAQDNFIINTTSGEIQVAKGASLDRDVTPQFEVSVSLRLKSLYYCLWKVDLFTSFEILVYSFHDVIIPLNICYDSLFFNVFNFILSLAFYFIFHDIQCHVRLISWRHLRNFFIMIITGGGGSSGQRRPDPPDLNHHPHRHIAGRQQQTPKVLSGELAMLFHPLCVMKSSKGKKLQVFLT